MNPEAVARREIVEALQAEYPTWTCGSDLEDGKPVYFAVQQVGREVIVHEAPNPLQLRALLRGPQAKPVASGPAAAPLAVPRVVPKATAPFGDRDAARVMGFEGEPCPTEGTFTMVRNGTCLKCVTCGATTGCS